MEQSAHSAARRDATSPAPCLSYRAINKSAPLPSRPDPPHALCFRNLCYGSPHVDSVSSCASHCDSCTWRARAVQRSYAHHTSPREGVHIMLATTRFKGAFWHITLVAALLALLTFALFLMGAMHSSVAHAQTPLCGTDPCGFQPEAGSPPPSGPRATVTTVGTCIVPSGLDEGNFVGTDNVFDVTTSSGEETLRCIAQDKVAPGRAAKLEGIPCQSIFRGHFTPGIVYESATGKITFICHFPAKG